MIENTLWGLDQTQFILLTIRRRGYRQLKTRNYSRAVVPQTATSYFDPPLFFHKAPAHTSIQESYLKYKSYGLYS